MLTLLPDFQCWVDQQVMTLDEASQLQALFQSMRSGETTPLPRHLESAMERLGLWGMVDSQTATRH